MLHKNPNQLHSGSNTGPMLAGTVKPHSVYSNNLGLYQLSRKFLLLSVSVLVLNGHDACAFETKSKLQLWICILLIYSLIQTISNED